jgi:D-lactate dehydrogenase (cytochrome)
MLEGVVQDGVLAQDTTQVKGLWQWREKIPEAITKSGTAMTYDVAMDIRLFNQMVSDVKEHFQARGLLGSRYSNILGFGHVGDGVRRGKNGRFIEYLADYPFFE